MNCIGCGTDYAEDPDGSAVHCPSCEAFLRRCTMRLSNKGLAEILSHEAIVLTPYKDSVGVWTYGVGHTAAAGQPVPELMPRGVSTTIERAIEVFRVDIGRYEAGVRQAVKVPLEQHEFDALVSFHFNTGGIFRAQLTEHLNNGDRVLAADAFLGWLKPREIEARRRKEMKLFRSGVYSNDGTVMVFTADRAGKVQWSKGREMDVSSILFGVEKPAPAPAAETRWPAWFWRIFG